MATYYVDMAVGADGNAGTSEGSDNAWKTIDKAMNTVAAGDKVWIKASADYTETATIDTAGTNVSPIVFEGYTTTTGDGGKCVIDGASTRANGIAKGGPTGSLYYVFKNIHVKNCTGVGFNITTSGGLVVFKNCEASNNGDWGFEVDNDCRFEMCISRSNSSGGGYKGDNGSFHFGSVAHSNTGNGFTCFSGNYLFCLAYGNSAAHFVGSGSVPAACINCTMDVQNAATHGINYSKSTMVFAAVANCIIYDAGTGSYGVTAGRDVGELNISRNNLVNDNVNNYNNFQTFSGELTTAPQFTDEAGGDYTLASGSPAKAAGVDAGESVNAVAYLDLGAHQREEAGGGGGGRVVLIG